MLGMSSGAKHSPLHVVVRRRFAIGKFEVIRGLPLLDHQLFQAPARARLTIQPRATVTGEMALGWAVRFVAKDAKGKRTKENVRKLDQVGAV